MINGRLGRIRAAVKCGDGNSIEGVLGAVKKEFPLEELPIRIVSIVRNCGFEVISKKLSRSDIFGFIAINNEYCNEFGTDKIICISSTDSPARQRFTIAHEFAHSIFDFTDTDTEYYDTYTTSDEPTKAEQRANKFAAELLMPQKIFFEKFNEIRQDYSEYCDVLFELSDTFGVPSAAVDSRIKIGSPLIQKVFDAYR